MSSDASNYEAWWRSSREREGALAARDINEDVRRWLAEEDLAVHPVAGLGASAHSRRSFLKLVGFGLAGSVAACSRAPTSKVIPYLVAPEEIVPGKSYSIATTCSGCEAGCGVLATCMDGRPIKLEGNPDSPISRGGLCASGQANLLSLYDERRLDGPRMRSDRGGAFESATWEDADLAIRQRIKKVQADGGAVRVLTGTIHSPSELATVERFAASFADAQHIMYDPLSCSAILDAHERTHGVRVLPTYRFEAARLIVSLDADFLGTWISPVEFARGWAQARNPERGTMARHVQLEARMSITGSSADERARLAPWEFAPTLAALCSQIAELAGTASPVDRPELAPALAATVSKIGAELWAQRGHAMLVCGSNSVAEQIVVNKINDLLGAYGTTLDLVRPSLQRRGSDRALMTLLAELRAGKVALLIVQGVNPLYDLPASVDAAAAFARVGTLIRIASHDDETAAAADFVCPEAHGLEAWGDAEPRAGEFHLRQPTLPPLRSARTFRVHLARWIGDTREDRVILRDHWQAELFKRAGGSSKFDAFFEAALQRGCVTAPSSQVPKAKAFDGAAVATPTQRALPESGTMGLVLYPTVGLLDGRHAHNPWLQELPDPVTKCVWDNYASVSPSAAKRLGVQQGDVVRVSAGELSVEVPVVVQPGQHDGVVAIALGYGRRGTDRFAGIGPEWLEKRATVAPGTLVGVNAVVLAPPDDGLVYDTQAVTVTKLARRVDIACTQDHHTLSVPEHLAPVGGGERPVVHSTTLAEWKKHGAHAFGEHAGHSESLWSEDHANDGHRWTMAIDLSVCTGCSGCVVACQAENNVPVVGKDEVRRHREMSWIRIDRYYRGDGDDVETVHQPMMCQHCAHAPCETVCPVLATVHSSEGLNQQVYNRCVGTRYCANNCPYKTRRFNWFDYPHEDRLQNMALNPDVTIRSRGIMEKCSMCIQRIQAAKAAAKRDGRAVGDGDISPACEQSCPSQAIVFGDGNDPKSRVSKALRSQRAYTVLSELGVKPGVHYLGVVRNKQEGHG